MTSSEARFTFQKAGMHLTEELNADFLLEAERIFVFTWDLTPKEYALQFTCGSGFQNTFIIFIIWQK